MFKRIMIAVNASPQAEYALQAGTELAMQLAAEVALIHVVTPVATYATEYGMAPITTAQDLKSTGEELLKRAQGKVPAALPCRTILREGDAAEEIVSAAREWEADLIVTGTHGRGRISQFLLGSTAESIIRHSGCPVIAMRDRLALHNPQVPVA